MVSVEELRAHLCLLREFKDLRTLVEGGQIAEWPAMVQSWAPEQRWAWFVGLAVERYVPPVQVFNACSEMMGQVPEMGGDYDAVHFSGYLDRPRDAAY